MTIYQGVNLVASFRYGSTMVFMSCFLQLLVFNWSGMNDPINQGASQRQREAKHMYDEAIYDNSELRYRR